MNAYILLRKLANVFVREVKENLKSSKYPSGTDRAGRDYDPIGETFNIESPRLKQSGGEIEIAVGSEKAPYTRMYEFGSKAYKIIPAGLMAFAKEFWPQYKPPPPAPMFFVFPEVQHPEFEGRPYIKPVVDSFDSEIREVLDRESVKKLLFGDKPRVEVW